LISSRLSDDFSLIYARKVIDYGIIPSITSIITNFTPFALLWTPAEFSGFIAGATMDKFRRARNDCDFIDSQFGRLEVHRQGHKVGGDFFDGRF